MSAYDELKYEKSLVPNSHKFKEEQKAALQEKKVQKITKGRVKKKKKSEIKKLTDVFIQEDVSNVKSYILLDVLLPTAKETIWNIFTNSLDILLFGGSGHSNKKSDPFRVSYRDYSNPKRTSRGSSDYRTNRYSYDDIALESRREAEEVLAQLDALISTYGTASVADLYDLVGVSHNFTDNNYGWTNIRNAEVVRTRDGYVLKLPKAIPMD